MNCYKIRTNSEEHTKLQERSFNHLLRELGQASEAEIESFLAGREVVQPETKLTPEVITHFRERIQKSKKLSM